MGSERGAAAELEKQVIGGQGNLKRRTYRNEERSLLTLGERNSAAEERADKRERPCVSSRSPSRAYGQRCNEVADEVEVFLLAPPGAAAVLTPQGIRL